MAGYKRNGIKNLARGHLTIGSRGSRLALWQAGWIRDRLGTLHTDLEIHIEIIKTSGDALRDVPLAIIGGKGVFTKEIEEALIDGRVDVAVHSLKDLPTILPEALALAAVTERQDARDALVLGANEESSNISLETLPRGAVVGTSSPRRLAQLKHLRPDLSVKDLRGNVDTRLRKLDAGEYDGVILAAAGLYRMGFEHRINQFISTEMMLPAVGQGALAVETRAADEETMRLVAPLNHAETRAACLAERALLRALGGGCQLPIAAHATIQENQLRLDGLVASVAGELVVRDTMEGKLSEAEGIGAALAVRLRELGADALLDGMAK